MATEDFIPVVDFADLASSQDLSSCAQMQELHSAFSKVGFVFVKNHGIERQAVEFLTIILMFGHQNLFLYLLVDRPSV